MIFGGIKTVKKGRGWLCLEMALTLSGVDGTVCFSTFYHYGKKDDMRRRERRSKQPLDNLQEARSYRKLKEALDRTLRRTRMEKHYEYVVLQTT